MPSEWVNLSPVRGKFVINKNNRLQFYRIIFANNINKIQTTYCNYIRYSKINSQSKTKTSMISIANGFCERYDITVRNNTIKHVRKNRSQFLCAPLNCECESKSITNTITKPFAPLNKFAVLFANKIMDLGQITARSQGYILKYIWGELVRLTPIYCEVKK